VLAVFTAFSVGADYYSILRSLPAFLYQVGLVTSIAITFVPQTVTRFTEIRDATALRGHKIRRVKDLLPVIMPLLSGGMERSMNLAEAMEARGFSRFHNSTSNISPVMVQSGLAIATGLIFGGGALLAISSTIQLIGWLTIVAGVSLLGLTVRAVGPSNKRTRLRRLSWRERDTILASLCLGFVAFFIAYRFIAPLALVFYPFPSVYAPLFDPVLGVAILLLAVPVGAAARFTAPHIRLGTTYSNPKSESGKKL
jgi:energy-coupling factor transport system permease protein